MEVTPTDLQKHVTKVNAMLQEICQAPDPAPLIQVRDGIIALASSCPAALRREVTTDLGIREIALRLPNPDADNPRFWIALQEQWRYKGKHRLLFVQCGLRLYIGDRSEEAVQFLRLEWVAPEVDNSGIETYQGNHAGHPHWHVDRSALVGERDSLRSLEVLTAPSEVVEAEDFGSAVASSQVRALFDFSWLQHVHLPAQARWMQSEWDGHQVPGPHQCEPNNLDEIAHWWAGALRYFSAELPH